MLIFLQHCAIWFDLVLWSDEGRTRRTPPSCQVSINQTHRNVHILSVICRKLYIFVPPFSRSVVALVVKFNALKGRVIHGNQFWTATNVADGLTALAICIEACVPFCPSSCFLADEYTDDLFLALHDVVFHLEHVPGETRRAPHKHLATTLGLDQLMYAV